MRLARGAWALGPLGRSWATKPNPKPIKYNVFADDDQLAFGLQEVLERLGLGTWEHLREDRVGVLCFQTGTVVCTGKHEDMVKWMQVRGCLAMESGGHRGGV